MALKHPRCITKLHLQMRTEVWLISLLMNIEKKIFYLVFVIRKFRREDRRVKHLELIYYDQDD